MNGMNYLVIKNHINVFCEDKIAMNKALADLKDAKGVKLYKIEEITLEVRQPVVPCMEDE